MNKSHVNPKIITWARKRAGYSIEDLSERMKKDPREIQLWEKGDEQPSYPCLERLAYTHLKVPVAVFFFPAPPELEDPRQKLRRIPPYELDRFSPDTFENIRLAQGYQDSLAFLMEDSPPSKQIFRDIDPTGSRPDQLARTAREYLGINLEQQASFPSPEKAFKAWRHGVEEVGVFTFKNSFSDRFISGFSLLHDDFPIIFVNNSNAFSRQVFTLIHELGHILHGVSGVTDFDESYLDLMSDADQRLEARCNKFAAHFLVPDSTFGEDIAYYQSAEPEAISHIAAKYSVSREVILRRLLDHEVVTQEYYQQKASEWYKAFLGRGPKASGGNYYLTPIAYLGEGFTRIALHNHYRGRISRAQVATHLNINSRYLAKLEGYMRW